MLKRRRQAETAKPPENESIFTMIDRVIWTLVRIVGLMLAAAILTPHFSVLLVLATALLCWLSARMGMKKVANYIT
ncbi:hypothetical protein WG219_12800 [Ectopseudomonas mendocina]|uniref:Uncharacterized protein n=1 Tax=Ectopseudomonas mendocina TaxID=300 RepID=A0ABZ2RF62_ECTME